jgi:NADH-quinone oxidoreductase subunit H
MLPLVGIVEGQRDLWNVVHPRHLVGFSIFMVASLAELTRPLFDMPVADSEIIFGALTEYTA